MNKQPGKPLPPITHLKPAPREQSARTVADLEQAGLTGPAERQALERVATRFSISITEPMLDLIDPADPRDPLAMQFVPQADELIDSRDELQDPIGDDTHSPLPGIVHRYPDRLLLTPLRICPVYCRFCFRRENVGNNGDGLLSAEQLAAAFDYIESHSEVWEVILSGGDPLMLSPRRLEEIIARLNRIDHVKVIRIHTRVPVVDPERINPAMVAALKNNKATWVVLHSNHPRELTNEARAACARLIDGGIPMLSQTVLLKSVNNDSETLEELMRALVETRIKPYYLHHADRARGTAHFRTTISQGQSLVRELRGRVSGLCQPEYVLDIPGGAGKVPVAAAWHELQDDGSYAITDYQGGLHRCADSADIDRT